VRAYTKAALAAIAGTCLLGTGIAADAAPTDQGDALGVAVSKLDRSAAWTQVDKIKLNFPTHHPQGFTRVGDRLFMSSVEIIERPVKYPAPVDGYDRTPGKGVGHVFELDLHGNLVHDIVLGEGIVYHPGGIDADANSLWVPVAQYRPNSSSIVYRIDLATLAVHEEFRVADHIGGIVPDHGTLRGVSWGSRRMYTWNQQGHELGKVLNRSHFVDYQDCAAAGRHTLLCTGITGFTNPAGAAFELGGIAVIDLPSLDIRHEVPVTLWSSAGHVATRNPVHLELDGSKLRMWAAPDDGDEGVGTEILVYETRVS